MARILTAGAEMGNLWADGATVWRGSVINRVSGSVPSSPFGNRSNWSYYLSNDTGTEFDFEPQFPGGLDEVYIRLHFWPGNRSDGTWETFRLTTPDGSMMIRHVMIDNGSGSVSGGLYYNAFYNSAGSNFVSNNGFSYRNSEWNLLEFHFKFGGSGGRVRMKVNGFQIIDWTGSLVGPAAESTFTRFRLHNDQISAGGARTMYYDNIAVNDITGTLNNGWIGDGYIMPFFPSGAGTTTQLVNSDRSSVDNFKFINRRREVNPIMFLSPTAPNDKDTYTLPGPDSEFHGVNALAVTASTIRYGASITQARLLVQPPSPQAEIQSANKAIPQGEEDWIRAEFNNNTNTGDTFSISELEDMETGIQFLA